MGHDNRKEANKKRKEGALKQRVRLRSKLLEADAQPHGHGAVSQRPPARKIHLELEASSQGYNTCSKGVVRNAEVRI